MNDKKSTEDYTLTAFGEHLTQDDAIAFFKDKLKSLACPACQYSSRIVMLTGAEDESAMVIPTRNAVKTEVENQTTFRSPEGGRELPVFGLWCSNCGHVQLHTVGTLAAWKNAKETAGAEEQ